MMSETFLLDALCKAQGGFFFEATETADAESLRRIGALIGEYTDSPVPVRPADWHEVLDGLLALGEQGPTTVVIDEFPYLAKANPSLPSVIQAAFGRAANGGCARRPGCCVAPTSSGPPAGSRACHRTADGQKWPSVPCWVPEEEAVAATA